MSTHRIDGPSSFGVRGNVRPSEPIDPPARAVKPGHSRWIRAIALFLLALGAWQIASAGWIHAKALVAQKLISAAWREARDAGIAPRPWPWADMRPIARLTVPARGVDLFVLDGASGRALAFGPGHVSGSARPGTWGNTVIVAHRDTHFAFLRGLAVDEEIDLEVAKGVRARYRVREAAVVDKSEAGLLEEGDSARLTLVTCYPFDAIRPGTALRFVVIAERIA